MSRSHRSRHRPPRRTGSRTSRRVQRHWRVRLRHRQHAGPMRLTLRTNCGRGVALGVSLALLTVPFLVSCARQPLHLSPSTSQQAANPPPGPPASPRPIHFQGLDHNYRGSTSIHSEERQSHQKEPP